jgi:hypothetical protein
MDKWYVCAVVSQGLVGAVKYEIADGSPRIDQHHRVQQQDHARRMQDVSQRQTKGI